MEMPQGWALAKVLKSYKKIMDFRPTEKIETFQAFQMFLEGPRAPRILRNIKYVGYLE